MKGPLVNVLTNNRHLILLSSFLSFSPIISCVLLVLLFLDLRYNGKKIKSDDEDIYKQVKTGKRYLAKIDIVTYKDGTTEYDVMKIISKVKEK